MFQNLMTQAMNFLHEWTLPICLVIIFLFATYLAYKDLKNKEVPADPLYFSFFFWIVLIVYLSHIVFQDYTYITASIFAFLIFVLLEKLPWWLWKEISIMWDWDKYYFIALLGFIYWIQIILFLIMWIEIVPKPYYDILIYITVVSFTASFIEIAKSDGKREKFKPMALFPYLYVWVPLFIALKIFIS